MSAERPRRIATAAEFRRAWLEAYDVPAWLRSREAIEAWVSGEADVVFPDGALWVREERAN